MSKAERILAKYDPSIRQGNAARRNKQKKESGRQERSLYDSWFDCFDYKEVSDGIIEAFRSDRLIRDIVIIDDFYPEPMKPRSYNQEFNAYKIEPTQVKSKRKEFCYRLEDERGRGVYSSNCRHPSAQDPTVMVNHPAPLGDPLLKDIWKELGGDGWDGESRNYYFGFSSMEQLRRWFYDPEYLETIQSQGIRIAIYQTDDFHIGDTQMIFRKSTAKLIGHADLI